MKLLHTDPLRDLFGKDLTRKEFLTHFLGIILAVIGVVGLFDKLADPFGRAKNAPRKVGYGASAYGGTSVPALSSMKMNQ